MSLRQLRKIRGPPTLPPPHSSSDEEYEPAYVKNSNKSQYKDLVLTSSAGSEVEKSSSDESEPKIQPQILKVKKKNNRKRRKSKLLQQKEKNTFDLDEIDKSLMEVNAILGEPSCTNTAPIRPTVQTNPSDKLYRIQFKHLIASNELTRLFGPEETDGTKKKPPRPQNVRCAKNGSFIERNIKFQAKGLSMSIDRRENGCTYFTYNHHKDYQNRHKNLLTLLLLRQREMMVPSGQLIEKMHIEEIIEEADVRFHIEEYTAAIELVEIAIAYMLNVASPFFNITNPSTRLEYKFIENRPFHILLLKYVYLVSNKACHRTGMEVAKLLLNLDPSDPLGVQMIIDTLALRAREHQWLIDTIDHLTVEKNAAYMFNMRYSYAMAHYHVIKKEKGDLKKADTLLKSAILRFPSFVNSLLNAAKQQPCDVLKNSTLYNSYAEATTSKSLKVTIKLYADLSCDKWRERPVMQWFLRNAVEVSLKYDSEPKIKEKAALFANVRNTLFVGWPEEIIRHFSVMLPLSNFVADGAFPKLPPTFGFNPVPPKDTVDRYGYSRYSYHMIDSETPAIVRFFSTIFPGYNLHRPPPAQEINNLPPVFNLQNERGVVDEVPAEAIMQEDTMLTTDDELLDGVEMEGNLELEVEEVDEEDEEEDVDDPEDAPATNVANAQERGRN